MGKSLKAAILCLGLLFALPMYAQGILPGVLSPVSAKPQSGTPSFSPGTGTYTGTQSVTISATGGSVICYNTTGSPATNGSTGCTTGTLYTGAVSVSTSETLYAVSGGTGYTDSSVGSAVYTISAVPTFVQSCTGPGNGGYETSINTTCASPVGAGHLLFFAFANGTSASSITLTGDTGTLQADWSNYSVSGVYGSTLYVLSASGGGTTLTITAGSGYFNYAQTIVDEYACPVGKSWAFDKSDAGNSGTGTAWTSNSITPTNNGETIIGYTLDAPGSASGTLTANSPFSLSQTGYYEQSLEYFLQQPTAGSIAASFAFTSSTTWGAHVAAFYCH
jgi:hypothetical protein